MLKNKTAIVTGGSSGIGAAIAKRLGASGANVAVVASSDRNKAKLISDDIIAKGGAAEPFVADVRDRKSIADLVQAVTEQWSPPTILVAAAGVFSPNAIGEKQGMEVFDQTIDTNLKSVYYCIDAVVPGMAAAGGGAIVAISSVAAMVGVRQHSAYCASKAAISMMVRALALELAPQNININAVAPGNTRTPMNEPMRTDPALAGFLEALKERTPSARIFSEPEDIAEMVHLMVSPAGRAMHGSTVLMDEGISAGI